MATSLPELAPHLASVPHFGTEIALTGAWITRGARSKLSQRTLVEKFQVLRAEEYFSHGLLEMEINPGVAGGVVTHFVFASAEAMAHYFNSLARASIEQLVTMANPEPHLARGIKVPAHPAKELGGQHIPIIFGEWAYGFIRDSYAKPDPASAIMVSAQWSCINDDETSLQELTRLWQVVGTEAYEMEPELLRFEAYRIPGQHSMIIHEVFGTNKELQFHLQKGTAAIYKKDLDAVSTAKIYLFRGPVSWLIRTYSKVLRLPATYSSRDPRLPQAGNSMTDGK